MSERNQRYLTREDIEMLTGFQLPSKQCKKLRESGIYFVTRRDGYPITTWGHVESPVSTRYLQQKDEPEEPDFEAM
jgi:hypothetical protein